MAWEIRQLLLVIHIFLAIVWVGGVLFTGWGVFPAAQMLTYNIQQQFFLALIKWTHWLFIGVGSFVILTGILLGTVAGPINTWNDVWNTSYGNTWFTTLITSLATLMWGTFVAYRFAIKLFTNVDLWKDAASGNKKPLTNALIRLIAIESIEVAGFIVLIFLMVSL
ncbi:hypothetical protein [Virgibacillus sp. DJP39]|uniref:hypothetical protein n=1 Tax=Virgibacillus sp. DJP39 TaxID=3409790 RepID=UPI003BB78290